MFCAFELQQDDLSNKESLGTNLARKRLAKFGTPVSGYYAPPSLSELRQSVKPTDKPDIDVQGEITRT